MNRIDATLQKIAPHFGPGGRLARWYPLYEAVDSFVMGSRRTTSNAPHIRDGIDLKRIMIIVVVSLIPCVIMAMWNTGYQANLALQSLGVACPTGWRGAIMQFTSCEPTSLIANLTHGALYFLPIYLVSVGVGSLWEGLFNILRGHEMSEAFLVTSLLFPLTLPATIPLWQVAMGISFGVIFAKEAFGGVGKNFMNPALAARAFIFFAYPVQMSGDLVWVGVDGFSKATPLAVLAGAQAKAPLAGLAYSWTDAFIGNIPGSMGETSALACLLGAVLLLVTGLASWRVISGMLLGGLGLATTFWLIGSATNPMVNVPPYWHLVLGGFAFGLVFMATDPVSAAMTNVGQYIYGALIGIVTLVVRVLNPGFPEGTMLAILFGNTFAPLIDYYVVRANIRRRALRHV